MADEKKLSGEARIDALCASLSAMHGLSFPVEVYDPSPVVEDGSGSGKYGPSDWTSAPMDETGFPI